MDFQLVAITIDTDVAFRQVLAVCTADDIESVVQLLGNNSTIIALELQAVFHSSYLVFASLIGINDTSDTIFSIFAIDTL